MANKNLLKTILNVNCVKIKNWKIDLSKSTIYIHVDMTKGQKRRCPVCGKKCKGYDSTTELRQWRSLDLGPFKVFLMCDVKRINCKEHGVHTEQVPWAYHKSRFTKDFENQLAYLTLYMSKSDVKKIVRVSWSTVGDVFTRARKRLEPDSRVRFNNLTQIGIDETSYKKGHKYLTVIIDHVKNQIIWVKEGTGKEVLQSFFDELSDAQKATIKHVSGDGAGWIIDTVKENLPDAAYCLDPFHTVQWAIEAMDKLRKEEWHKAIVKEKEAQNRKEKKISKTEKEKVGKAAKYALGKNPENLTEYQSSCLDSIKEIYPRMFRGYQLKEGLRAVFRAEDDKVETELNRWLSWACRSKLEPFVELSRKIRRHKSLILDTIKYKISNSRVESMNNRIKVLIRKSYGFRNIDNLKDLIMVSCSGLRNQIKMPYDIKLRMNDM